MSVISTPTGYTVRLDANASGFAFSGFQRIPTMADATYVVWTSGSLCQTMNTATGVVEYSGTNSTSGIQWALTHLTSGRTWKEAVKIKGLHYVTKLLVPSYLLFDATEGTLFQISGTNTVMVQNEAAPAGNIYMEFQGGTYDGNREGQTGGGSASGHSMFHFRECSYIQIHHGLFNHANYHCFYLLHCPTGIQINDNRIANWKQEGVCDHNLSGGGGYCHHHQVSNNYFVHDEPSYGGGIVGSCAISTIGVDDYVFSNNVSEITRAGSAVTLNGKRSVIANNVITSGAAGGIIIAQGTDSRYDSSESIITGNTVKNMTSACIHAQNGFFGQDLTIADNFVDTTVTPNFGGIVVQDWKGFTITGNTAKNCVGPGIEIVGTITNSGVFNGVIDGNICYNNGQGLSATDDKRAGIAVNGATSGTSAYVSVYNNLCYDNQSSGTQRYGIRFNRTWFCIAKDNDVRRNTTSGISLSTHSGSIVHDNAGYDE